MLPPGMGFISTEDPSGLESDIPGVGDMVAGRSSRGPPEPAKWRRSSGDSEETGAMGYAAGSGPVGVPYPAVYWRYIPSTTRVVTATRTGDAARGTSCRSRRAMELAAAPATTAIPTRPTSPIRSHLRSGSIQLDIVNCRIDKVASFHETTGGRESQRPSSVQ